MSAAAPGQFSTANSSVTLVEESFHRMIYRRRRPTWSQIIIGHHARIVTGRLCLPVFHRRRSGS